MASSLSILVILLSFLACSSKADEKTHLHFYLHDIISGRNPTSVPVATGPSHKKSAFGAIIVFDDPLTKGPDVSSAAVGRAQGIYAVDSLTEMALHMSVSLVFSTGEFNGSSVAVAGHNPFLQTIRELPIVGGTGVFRLARGYVLAKTYSFDSTTGNAVFEYDVYVTVDD